MRICIFALSLALSAAAMAYAQAPTAGAPAAATAPGGDVTQKAMPSAFVVKFKVKPGKNADFEKAFKEMQAGVRAHEPGNLYYDLYLSNEDPQTYVIIEHYKDQAALAAHRNTEHGKKLFAALGDLIEGRPEAQALILVSAK